MLAAAIALRYAFPYRLYGLGVHTSHHHGDLDDEEDGFDGDVVKGERCGLVSGKVWKNDGGTISVGRRGCGLS